MTRYTATEKNGRARLGLDVTTDRDETSGYRHKWTTTVRLGLLSASGPNLKTALANLEAEVLALVSSEAARSALAAERQKAMPAAPTPAKAPAPYAEGEMVEVLIQGIWCEAEFLNSSPGGSLYAIWSERCGSLVVPKERVRAVNRPSLGDVG